MSWAESKWVVDNILQKIGQAPNNMRAFTAFPVSKTSVGLKFSEPADSYSDGNLICAVGGVMIRMSDSGYPNSPSDGTLVLDNKNLGAYETSAFVVSGLVEGTEYFFSAFPYSTQGVYNQSSSEVNRAASIPAAGEIVNVSIDIDDVSAFRNATVTCVDETDGSSTQSAVLTSLTRNASFVVPNAHSYHIEYGAVDGYIKPENTYSKISEVGNTSSYAVIYKRFVSTINVTYPEGATLTCTGNGKQYTAESTTGEYQFKVHSTGVWVIKAVTDNDIDSKEVEITADGQVVNLMLSFGNIYGISRDITSSSPAWARTDMAVGKTATASIGMEAGHSDFDDCYPWSEIKRVTFPTGDVMVRIPKFYYQRYREGNIEHIRVADKPLDRFKLHPAFLLNDHERDEFFVSAYHASSGEDGLFYSKSGATATTGGDYVANIVKPIKKGAGWYTVMASAWWAIQMLFLVEFATYDSQTAVGAGLTGVSKASNLPLCGTCDDVPNLTGRPAGTDNTVDVVWRGIETPWGAGATPMAGALSAGNWYVSNNLETSHLEPAKTTFTDIGVYRPAEDGYVTEIIYVPGDYDYVLLPGSVNVEIGSSSTFICDTCDVPTSTSAVAVSPGGEYNEGAGGGLFHYQCTTSISGGPSTARYRLMYVEPDVMSHDET